ncbi:MAG TPA: hypothetical protein VMJ33_06835 [Gallionella sp.]|nr:hypothetical protein [Gallionella sp.]
MLRLLRDRVCIALCPDRLIAVHYRPGLRPRIVDKTVQHTYSSPETGWQATLTLLKATLNNPAWKDADATLILSNHFVHFLLLPWNDVALTEEEKLSLLQLRFAEVYGEASATWELRLNEGSFGSPSLASAVDQGLLEQLKNIFDESTLRLKSIQPNLMAAFNRCYRKLGKDPAWLVVAEQGVFCVGLLREGEWQSIRLRRIEGEWFDEAMLVLEREMLLAEEQYERSKVYLYAPEMPVTAPIKRGALEILPLQPELPPVLSSGEMSIYAIAAAGV